MENMDMNYDLNDGIPPYDLPFEGTPYESSDNSGASDTPAQESNNPPYDVENVPSPEEEVSNEIEIESEDYVNTEETPSDINYEEEPKADKNHSKIMLPVIILLLVLILGCALYFIYGSDMISNLTANNEKPQTEEIVSEEVTEEVVNTDEPDDINKILSESSETIEVDMLRERHNRAIQNNLDDDTLARINGIPNQNGVNGISQNENDRLASLNPSLPRGNVGRLDPFNPAGSANQLFDVLMPPSNPTPDVEAQQLMTLKISGIMYTPDSPSALINIAGDDQLVRRGDKFNGFSVEGISKDKVTVRNGKNTYTASVGESINVESVGVNAIPNLNKKFGGPYSKGKGKIIEINTLN